MANTSADQAWMVNLKGKVVSVNPLLVKDLLESGFTMASKKEAKVAEAAIADAAAEAEALLEAKEVFKKAGKVLVAAKRAAKDPKPEPTKKGKPKK